MTIEPPKSKADKANKKNKKPKDAPVNKAFVDTSHIDRKKQEVIFAPHPGFQTEFVQSTEPEVFAGGGRGSGKSLCMLAIPLHFVENRRFRGLVIRKTTKQLRDLIRKAKELYIRHFGAIWKERDQLFVFPSGAVLEFNYLESMDDYEQYHGQEFDFIGVDEITEYPSEEIINKLRTCLRGGDPAIPKLFRCTGNPGGPGIRWVRERYMEKSPASISFIHTVNVQGTEISERRKWLHSTIDDNPTEADYKSRLIMSVGDNATLMKQWVEGSFDAVSGLAFDEFKQNAHVVAPFQIPHNWMKIRAMDWGYSSMAVCLWLAIDPEGAVYCYREVVTDHEQPDELMERILRMEYQNRETMHIAVLDGSAWSTHGEIGETPGQAMCRVGGRWTPADRSPGSRKAGKLIVHKFLALNKDTGIPGLRIFSTCKEIIRELKNLQISEDNQEDIDQTKKNRQPDHAYDALRYGLSAISPYVTEYEDINYNDDQRPAVMDEIFGY